MAEKGHGSTLVGASVGSLGEIRNIGGPSQSRDDIDTSSMDSSDMVRTFLPGMLDNGEVTCDLVFDDDTYDAVQDAMITEQETFTVTTPGGCTIAFPGYMKGNNPSADYEGIWMQNITLKCAGALTITPA